jgi:hypothetical protein
MSHYFWIVLVHFDDTGLTFLGIVKPAQPLDPGFGQHCADLE